VELFAAFDIFKGSVLTSVYLLCFYDNENRCVSLVIKLAAVLA